MSDKFIMPDRAELQIWESGFPKDFPRRVVMMEDTHLPAKVGDEVMTADGRAAVLVTEIGCDGRALCRLNPSPKFKINDRVEYWSGPNDSDYYTGVVVSEPSPSGYVQVQSETGSSCDILQDFLNLIEEKPDTPLSCSPQPDKGSLSFTIGLARSGKSTFCRKWQSEAPNRVVLSGDDFRYAVYGQRWIREGEEIVRSSLITAARALFRSGYDVMIDETNTTEASIRHILAISSDAVAYMIAPNLDLCVRRAHDAGHYDLPPSIARMNQNWNTTGPKVHSGEIPVRTLYFIDDNMAVHKLFQK